MRTALVLFTRDLRLHDQPALAAAAAADHVVPVFVFDESILRSRYAAPNRVAHLREAVEDLRRSLQGRGGDLVIRRGQVVEEVAEIVRAAEVDEIHLSDDVSAYARKRLGAVCAVADDLDVAVHTHPGVTVVAPGAVTPSSGDHFKVFTPYWRRWAEVDHREPVAAPSRIALPPGLEAGSLPALGDLVEGEPAAERRGGGETRAREDVDAWFEHGIETYESDRDLLAEEGTSRLSAHLHFGTISPAELAARIDRRKRGHDAYLRQLCWREFNHQLLAARPDLPREDYRSQGDRWIDDEDAFAAWREGRTGYPVIDAGMRQLVRTGYLHNRARMLVASFLTKHLRIDWRRGAWHFMDHLEDGDLANNFGGWQWVAGTGTDSRPNRLFNPVTQAQRYDPEGTYVRRYVPELADVDAGTIHAPWEADGTLLAVDYPPPLVDHAEARARFLADRGA